MEEQKTLFTRRRLLKGASVATGASILGGIGMWYGTQPAMAAEVTNWSAQSHTGESGDGTLDAVTAAPEIGIEWENFADGPSGADITLTASLPDQTGVSDIIFDVTGITDASGGDVSSVDGDELGGSAVAGSATITLAELDITADTDANGDAADITPSSFADSTSADGPAETSVSLELDTTLTGAQSSDPSANGSTNFTVTVENLAEDQTTNGTANTGVTGLTNTTNSSS